MTSSLGGNKKLYKTQEDLSFGYRLSHHLHHGPAASSSHAGRHSSHLFGSLAGPGVLHRLVDREDEAGGLRGRRNGVDLDDRRLPNAGDVVVRNIFVHDVDSVPAAPLK